MWYGWVPLQQPGPSPSIMAYALLLRSLRSLQASDGPGGSRRDRCMLWKTAHKLHGSLCSHHWKGSEIRKSSGHLSPKFVSAMPKIYWLLLLTSNGTVPSPTPSPHPSPGVRLHEPQFCLVGEVIDLCLVWDSDIQQSMWEFTESQPLIELDVSFLIRARNYSESENTYICELSRSGVSPPIVYHLHSLVGSLQQNIKDGGSLTPR